MESDFLVVVAWKPAHRVVRRVHGGALHGLCLLI
jgi:hypothetical protein